MLIIVIAQMEYRVCKTELQAPRASEVLCQGERYHVLFIIKTYGLDDRGSRVRFPTGAGNFSLHHRVQNGSGSHPASYPMGTRGSFLGGGVRRWGREADHSPPSSAEVEE
jgi:hypothetical protein